MTAATSPGPLNRRRIVPSRTTPPRRSMPAPHSTALLSLSCWRCSMPGYRARAGTPRAIHSGPLGGPFFVVCSFLIEKDNGCRACGKPRPWRFSIGSTPSAFARSFKCRRTDGQASVVGYRLRATARRARQRRDEARRPHAADRSRAHAIAEATGPTFQRSLDGRWRAAQRPQTAVEDDGANDSATRRFGARLLAVEEIPTS